ncbi:MAG: carbohydrate kinase family protein [Burkholderiales bacterium]|uniref:Carbohydrate kinase family protein n=1 Tax=Rubrivivax albus TaxID=2499835 RepID=A0A437JWU9_9BURK|nr:carbohydrate kinase family protein [Rubrivivax albus]RVT52152.1 carbohydrate kinase family protein [Rubrivivax albus]TNF55396.1 MAG: carbohydrate kinase family protein [Burkholderiales bacterium]
MPALICGSLAFDTITNFPGRFAQQILPDQVHILNVSFLVPTLRREFGGCAGNIAYNLHLLGGAPVVMAALGTDGAEYLARLQSWGADTTLVRQVQEIYTAQAMIITDQDNNQITAFHPGAMQHAHETRVPVDRSDLNIGIIAPDGRDAMLSHAQQMHDAGIPFIFDPGQGLPMFNPDELRHFVALARWIAVNDYEARMLCDRLGTDLADLSRAPGIEGVVVTRGAEGSEVWMAGHLTQCPPVVATAIADPTGCGDAFRAALLYGLERGWTLQRCAAIGNRLGACKIACHGPQNHRPSSAELLQ